MIKKCELNMWMIKENRRKIGNRSNLVLILRSYTGIHFDLQSVIHIHIAFFTQKIHAFASSDTNFHRKSRSSEQLYSKDKQFLDAE